MAYPDIAKLVQQALTASQPPGAPWPDELDTAEWTWTAAMPGWWQDAVGGRAEGSPDYRYWEALALGLEWARLLIDRVAARIDPYQALPEDLERLYLWANCDPEILSRLSGDALRSYVRNARRIDRVRGTEALEDALQAIVSAGVSVNWSTALPWRRIVQIVGSTVPAREIETLIRRVFPAHVEIFIENSVGLVAKTEDTWTEVAWTADQFFISNTV